MKFGNKNLIIPMEVNFRAESIGTVPIRYDMTVGTITYPLYASYCICTGTAGLHAHYKKLNRLSC